jgi:tetratricopeptide (TPR) repeat protein
MKVLSLLFGIAFISAAWAAPKDDMTVNNKLKQQAVALFQTGNGDQGASILSASLATPSKGDDRSVDVASSLLEVSVQLFNARQIPQAKDAAARAIAACNSLRVAKKSTPQLANLLTNIGVIYEQLYFDPDSALDAYQAALAINPALEKAKNRSDAVGEKIKQRKAVLGR